MVRLRDIGPFRELDVAFDEEATLLVGDNASGKSTILRALALGLAGASGDLSSAAGELLRTGTSSGSIEITAGRDVYRTVLRRDRGRDRVRVASESTSPVEAGLLLAVGFPALRGVSLRPPHGPAGAPVLPPNPADVLPLALGTIDERLDDVQQWVVDTYLRSTDGNVEVAAPAHAQLGRFFQTFDALTPGVDVALDSVDRQTWQVLLATADGVLPLTQVSRGMSALLGWVGTLVKRLYEVHSADAPEQPGLLLIDEIDLHIHPAWQRGILPLLRQQFPQLQVIASTHSPLVVGSTQDGVVVHLDREDGQVVTTILDEQSFAGWRSDQILTSPAFELPTTRDRHTQALLEEHARLTAGGEVDEQNRPRVEQLTQELRGLLPPPQETPIARQAASLVREALDQRIRELPEERQRAVADAAQRYLRELGGGGG
jgi:energy-coupling factor transporter ATP-binding protein EcfA2